MSPSERGCRRCSARTWYVGGDSPGDGRLVERALFHVRELRVRLIHRGRAGIYVSVLQVYHKRPYCSSVRSRVFPRRRGPSRPAGHITPKGLFPVMSPSSTANDVSPLTLRRDVAPLRSAVMRCLPLTSRRTHHAQRAHHCRKATSFARKGKHHFEPLSGGKKKGAGLQGTLKDSE